MKMFLKLWLLICATQLVIIKATYDPDRTGIKTRTYHRDRDYTNAEQQPYTNTQPYDNRPNYGAGSLRLSPSNSHQHYDQPPYGQQHQNQYQYQQQRSQPQPPQQQYENPQQADAYQQRDLPLYNRNAHVRHSPSSRQTERTESRRESGRSDVENTITDYNSGCPPQHTGPVPYPYDCRRFVNCWHGRGHIQSCGPGTVFNPETLECDRPDKVVCGNPNVNGALRDERRETQATVQSAPQQNKNRAGRLIDVGTDNVNALCPQGLTGLAPHPNDCTKFLNCANGNTHVQDCGPGTAFSASKKVCDFKENVDCSGRENAAYGTLNTRDGRQHDDVSCPAGASGLYPHPYDCAKFLNCAHGQTAIQPCGPGTAFDRVNSICDFAEKLVCATTSRSKPNLNYVDTNVDYENSVRKDEVEGDIFCPPAVSGHFPYPFDYTKFINCKNGNTAIQNCLPGTVYSISKNYCEPKENVPHTDRVAYIVSEVRYEYSVTIVSCPPSTDGLHLYPYDFMKHISCRQGHMWIITCPANMVFSIAGKSCRPESQVSVGDRVRSAWELQYSAEYSESRSAALNSLDETFMCPDGQSGLYPHPFDCKKYLKCLNGQLSVETCRPGEVFSLSSKHCDPKELVGVKEQVPAQFDVGQISTSESNYGYSTYNEGSIQLICPPHVNAFFLHPFDCTKYLYCRDGQGEVDSCNSGKVFSISRRECVNRNQVDAYDRVEYQSEVSHEFSTELEPSTNHLYEPNCAAGADSLYSHPTDNTKYIKCVEGQATVEHCIPGMIFSKIRKYCDFELRVHEYDSEAGNGYNVLGGTDGDGVATVTFNGGKSPTGSHGADVECPPNSAGMHPHPYNCHKFLQCDNGVTHVKDCGPGTAWSVEMEVCDFEKNVNCGGRIGTRTTATGIHVEQKVACPANMEGFYLHPFNGYQYIECKNGGETHVQACPPGSVFSISRQMCLAEDKVNANDHVVCIQEHSTTDINVHYNFVVCPALAMGYFIYPFDGLLFINCHAGHTMIESCEPNTLFSITNKICIPTSGAGSSDHVWLSTGEQRVSDSYGAYNHNREWSVVDTAEVATHTQSFAPPQHFPECPSSATGLYPHPTDCTKFLRCANSITHIMDCGPGTAFNIALEVCDFIDKVDCTGRVAGYNNVATGFGGDVRSESVACPEGASGMFPHPLDCTKFFNCNNGITNVQDCGPGTAWNAKLEVCDFIKNVDCSKNSGRNPKAPTAQGGREHNHNTNYQSPPLPQTNYGDQLQNNWGYRGEQQSYGSSTQHRPSYGGQNYGGNLPTTSTRTPKHGDRWSNMDMQRPIPSEQTYDGRYNPDYDRQQRLPNYGKELPPNSGANSWVGAGSAIDRQTPTQSIIYEEGSLQPNRNYNTFSTYTTPLAPFNSGSALTNETTNVYYAQPVGSEENTEEVFDDGKVMPQPPNSSPFNNPNEKDYVQSPSSNWIPIPNQVLLPPKRTDVPHGDRNDFPPQNIFTPAAYITSSPRPTHTSNYPVITPTVPTLPNFDASNLFGGLQPPPPPTTSPSPLNPISLPDNSFVSPNAIKGRPTGRSIDEIEPIRAFSTNAQGRPHLLSPPSNINAYTTDISTTTPATYLQPPALPTPAASTRLRSVHNLLDNTTVATFSKDPHYSGSYSNVAHAHRPKSIDTEDVKTPENALMADALRLLLRPYFNRSGTISEENAELAESHIMKLSPHLPTHTAESTTLPNSSSRVPKVGAENEKEVELILAGEQHSLTTIPIQNTTHETRTEFYSKNTIQESKPNTNWHNHGHSREFHRNHPNLLNPFNEDDERPSPHTHHRHKHNRAYHQRHPELPNPFATPEAPTTTTNYDLSNTNLPNPYAESTTPFSVRPPQIDLRVGNADCPFDCGNGKCVNSHEVCNGINNCGNRKDEDDCKHLGYEVRLTGGDNPNMGRVEVKILGKWGYVCDDKFGLRDAEVVCRELGFNLGASEVRGFSYYPPSGADVSFAMDEVECRGNETSLKECDFKGWGVSNCGPDEVVGVVCKVPQLRCPNNYWLCSTSQECIPPAFVCDNTPDCADKSDENESVCNSPIKYRLQGGRSPSEGRLEVRYRGEWGSVCDDDFGIKEAQVMCNSMGFYGTPTLAKNTYRPGSGPIWLDQVSCFGNETALDQCNHWTWGEHNCNHTEDVGLKCTVGAPPRKVTATPQSDESTQQELDETQQQLEDIGLFSEQWERKSKAVGEHRRCGQFKDTLIDEYAHPEERVVNGSVAKRGHHPWQATIRTRGRGGISSHWCGAVLISSRHLLTAAHCLAGYPKGAYLVRMGDHYANIAESSEVDSFIENWYVHEKFRDATHMNNDIAVVVLKTPVKFNDYIQPVCLPNKGAALAENRMCTISGWGSIKSGVSTPSNILRAAELPILSDEVCKQKHVYGGSMTEGMFCAGYMDESVDACDGDSGGPLICHDDDGETLYGIISWGQHCGYANKPGVYVRVEKYVDWILEKISFSMQKGS